MTECSKIVTGYDLPYKVTDGGRVFSSQNDFTRELIPQYNEKGYQYVVLQKNGRKQKVKIHRLVAQYFLPDYDELGWVRHIDRNRTNNCASNLRIVSVFRSCCSFE